MPAYFFLPRPLVVVDDSIYAFLWAVSHIVFGQTCPLIFDSYCMVSCMYIIPGGEITRALSYIIDLIWVFSCIKGEGPSAQRTELPRHRRSTSSNRNLPIWRRESHAVCIPSFRCRRDSRALSQLVDDQPCDIYILDKGMTHKHKHEHTSLTEWH